LGAPNLDLGMERRFRIFLNDLIEIGVKPAFKLEKTVVYRFKFDLGILMS
jgi:hypothetical protein